MAKQTFTTGQVLTAAQMTSLQQTAMGGGAATAKTASYVLVAADAGTTVAMNAAGATTITVNTGLFAAGDTVFIQNLGAGACTVTAGTATVATAGSLILPQNDAGILYFTATGASIFYDFIQAGAVSPLTTKGDVYTFSTSDARIGVGANNTVLTADSAEATGLKWATPSASTPVFSNIANGTITSGATLSLTGLTSYDEIRLTLMSATNAGGNSQIRIRFNSVTTSNYQNNLGTLYINSTGSTFTAATAESGSAGITSDAIRSSGNYKNSDISNALFLNLYGCKSASGFILGDFNNFITTDSGPGVRCTAGNVGLAQNATLSSIQIDWEDGYNFTGGSYRLLGA